MSSHVDLRLPRGTTAAQVARRAVRDSFARHLEPPRMHDLALVVTELVTNAVAHGRGEIVLRVKLEGERVIGEVVDEGKGFEQEVRVRGPEDVGGRGLLIVDALSSRWGIHEGTTHVWFELAQDAPAQRTDPQLGDERRPSTLDRAP
jgi:anti-sigma regulatory factor (Ser/Thr protein kinase)